MLVTGSSEIDSVVMLVIIIGLVLRIVLLDWVVFTNIDKLTKYLDPSRLAVVEAVFGVLLAT